MKNDQKKAKNEKITILKEGILKSHLDVSLYQKSDVYDEKWSQYASDKIY